MNPTELREQRGMEIAKTTGQISRLDEHHYSVRSQSGNGEYAVIATESGWLCECPDFVNRFFIGKCKHIWAVEFSQLIRKRVENQVVIAPLTVEGYPKCRSLLTPLSLCRQLDRTQESDINTVLALP